jgi:hypothetical protein
MKRNAVWVLGALLVGLGARGQDLPPLVPPPPTDAPWLKKNQTPPEKKKSAKKAKKKKPASPQAVEAKPAEPPLALPPLEPLKEAEPAKPPVEAAKPPVQEPAPPVEAAKPPAQEPLPPLVPLAPAPPPAQVDSVAAEKHGPAPVAAVTGAPPAPAPRSNWQKPTALAALGAGIAVAATGVYFGAKSHSDLNNAENAFHSNGGAFLPADVETLNSGNSAAKTANILFVVSGALLATSALVAFAF